MPQAWCADSLKVSDAPLPTGVFLVMPAPTQRLDKHGFPIPGKFDSPVPVDAGTEPPHRSPVFGRIFLVALLMAIVAAIVVESPLVDWARSSWVEFLAKRAIEKYQLDDLQGALRDMDLAIAWLPADTNEPLDAELHRFRASWRLENKQIDEAMEDATRAVELRPNTSDPYLTRSIVFQRLGNHERAIADLDLAVKFGAGRNDEALNARAYARALANVELEEGLADIGQALAAVPNNPDFLDTRGYLYLLHGDTDEALVDMERAVAVAQQQRAVQLDRIGRVAASPKQFERVKRLLDEKLSVMFHHRGEVYEKLGRLDEAASDLNKAEKLGYNPAEGVY